jgi:hypothetical protein
VTSATGHASATAQIAMGSGPAAARVTSDTGGTLARRRSA